MTKESQKVEFFMKMFLVLLGFVAWFGGCSYLNNQWGLDDDNIVEEIAEEAIEHYTGVEVDLTPSSDER